MGPAAPFLAAAFKWFVFNMAKRALFRWIVTTLFMTGLNLALRKKPKIGSVDQGQRLQLKLNPTATREIVVGTTAVGGSLVYWNVYGSANENLELVIAVSDYQTTALNTMLANGKTVGVAGEPLAHLGSGAVPDFNHPDASTGMTITYFDGREAQTADAGLAANGPWTSNHKGVGVSYIKAELVFDPVTYERGVPDMAFVIQGAPIFSDRAGDTYATKSTHSYSANGPDILRHFLRGFRTDGGVKIAGPGIDADGLSDSTFNAAANDADSSVSLDAGGTETKYETHGVISTSDSHESTVRALLSSFGGDLIDRGGVYACLSGSSQSSALTLDDGDIIASTPFDREPRRSRDEVVNAIKSRFVDSGAQYQEGEILPRIDATAVTEDGGERKTDLLDLPLVQSETQAQRLAQIYLRRSRFQRVVNFTARARAIQLEAGDWFEMDLERYGWTGGSVKTFEVLSTSLNLKNLTVGIAAQEIASSVYAWTPATDEQPAATSNTISNPASITIAVASLTVTSSVVTSGSAQVAEIRAQFTPSTDSRVIGHELQYRIGSSGTIVSKLYGPDETDVRFRDGIFSGTTYEVRVRPYAQTAETSWTSWTSITAASAPITGAMIAGNTIGTSEISQNAVTNAESAISTAAIGTAGVGVNGQDQTLVSITGFTVVAGSSVIIRFGFARGVLDSSAAPNFRATRDQASWTVDVWLRLLRGTTEIYAEKISALPLGTTVEYEDFENAVGFYRTVESTGHTAGAHDYKLVVTFYRSGTTTDEASDLEVQELYRSLDILEVRDR